MRFILRLFLLALSIFQITPVLSRAATEAIVTRTATLRGDPSSQHRPILVLQSGDDVELLDPAPTHNYYHVRTSDGMDGWVYSRSVEIVATPAATSPAIPGGTHVSTSPTGAPQPGISSVFSPNWD